MARIVEDWNYNNIDNTIQIGPAEIKNLQSLMKASDEKTYLINYDYVSKTREDIESLATYFTPIIKDYALKFITKSGLL